MDLYHLTELTSDMTPEKWRIVPVELVEVSAINLLQEQIDVGSLINAAVSEYDKGMDPFPHLVSIRKALWAEEGLNRILVWRIRGCGLMPMRVLRLRES